MDFIRTTISGNYAGWDGGGINDIGVATLVESTIDAGNDKLRGDAGLDVLIGGAGRDDLKGGKDENENVA